VAVENEKQSDALKDKGMSKERAAKIANSPDVSKRGGERSGTGGDASQGGTTARSRLPAAKAARQPPRSPPSADGPPRRRVPSLLAIRRMP
jgi:hypothetical protein